MIRAGLDENDVAHIMSSPSELISLCLPQRGMGSYPELVEYVRTVLEQNTVNNQVSTNGCFDILARNMLYSILHRLHIDWERIPDHEHTSACGLDRPRPGPGARWPPDPFGPVDQR